MEINHWTIFTKSNIARIVKAVPPSHKWMREKLNVSGLKSQVRIKMKKTVVVQKSGANLQKLRLDRKEDIFFGTCQQRFSASFCPPLQLESCYDLQWRVSFSTKNVPMLLLVRHICCHIYIGHSASLLTLRSCDDCQMEGLRVWLCQ